MLPQAKNTKTPPPNDPAQAPAATASLTDRILTLCTSARLGVREAIAKAIQQKAHPARSRETQKLDSIVF